MYFVFFSSNSCIFNKYVSYDMSVTQANLFIIYQIIHSFDQFLNKKAADFIVMNAFPQDDLHNLVA